MLPLLRTDLKGFEGGVRVLAIDGLMIDPVKGWPSRFVLRRFDVGQTCDVPAMRCIVPIDFVCGDKVGADNPLRLSFMRLAWFFFDILLHRRHRRAVRCRMNPFLWSA